jgi:thioredoxin-like negative regulator of GroEL
MKLKMKKYILIAFLFISQISQAEWLTSLEDAQKLALVSNKFIVIDFWASWCRPCREMDLKSWNNPQVTEELEGYVKLKLDMDSNKRIASKYGVSSIPVMMILDANGKVVYQFSGYHDASNLKYELEKFNLSTEFLNVDLINFYKSQNFNTAVRMALKYYEYSLFADQNIKDKIITVTDEYLKDAKKTLDQKDVLFTQKKQKLELINLYALAYNFNFQKLKAKISEIKPEKIDEANQYNYWFLKYISLKGTNENTAEIEELLKSKDLEIVITKGNQLYAFYEKSSQK